jgi:hypothetical protein
MIQNMASKRNKAEQDRFGARSQSEFYIIIFLNKLNKSWKWKNQNKISMAKAMGPFRDSYASSWFSGYRTDVPAEQSPTPGHRIGPDTDTLLCYVLSK